MPKAAASKAHLRGDGVEDVQLTKMLDDEYDFPQPTGGRGDSFGSGLDDHRRISDTGHVYLLVGKFCILPSKEAHFMPARYKLYLVAQFVGNSELGNEAQIS